MISAKSDKPDVVLVSDNLKNAANIPIHANGLKIIGLKEGTATITVTAKESKDAAPMNSANLEQSVSMTFNVTVRAPTSST